MDIMYATDDRYLDIMLGSIYSLICNGNIKNLKIHIITSNFSKNNYKKIELFFNLYPDIKYYFYPLETFDIEKYGIPEWRNSQIANARLFFQEILKDSIDKIDNLLYLDSDTIIVDDLNDLNNYTDGIFAVKDGGRLKKKYITLGNLTNYYNSGVIYINVNEWLNNDYQTKIINTIESNNIKFILPDQDILNTSLSNQITPLPFEYNVPPFTYIFNGILGKLYFNNQKKCVGYDEVIYSKEHPKILHSYGFSNIKAWDSKINPFHDEFMKYILSINPEFKSKELSNIKKLITTIPTLYYAIVLTRIYLPNNTEEQLNKMISYIKNKMH